MKRDVPMNPIGPQQVVRGGQMTGPSPGMGMPSGMGGPPGMGDIFAPEPHWKQFSADRTPRRSEVVDRPANYGPPIKPPPGSEWICNLIEQTKQQFLDRLGGMISRKVFFSKRPSYLEPPFFAKPIFLIDQRNITANTAAPGEVVVSFRIPFRHRAVITGFGMDADDPCNFEDLSWSFTIDNVPVFPWVNIQHQIGSIQTPFSAVGPVVRITENKTIEFRAANANATDVKDIRALVFGYFYPLEENIEFAGGEIQL